MAGPIRTSLPRAGKGLFEGFLSFLPLRRVRRWSIAIYGGASPLSLAPMPKIRNPVLTAKDVTDVRARYVADPFMLRRDSTWYMLFEVLDDDSGLGKIGYAQSEDGLRWKYRGIVLDEPFHQSYPYLIAAESEIYMVPESGDCHAVRLYRASAFPSRWDFVGNILDGDRLVDPSLIRHRDRWWLFATTGSRKEATLRLYHADKIEGLWTEHPRSPVVRSDPRLGRSAGRVFEYKGRLFRYAQDGSQWYGQAVWAVEITEMSEVAYSERIVGSAPVLTRRTLGWNSLGMHHIDPHQLEAGRWIACVDGHRNSLSIRS